MNYFQHCPIPASGGKDCVREPHPANSFGICVEHWREVAQQWISEEPAVTILCSHCSQATSIDMVELSFATCQRCHKRISDVETIQDMIERQAAYKPTPQSEIKGVVYYMRFSDRVKIGFTTDLEARSKQIPFDEVVAAEPGTYALERRRHTEFLEERMSERGEWFTLTPRLAFHMANVRDRYGEPFAVKAGSLVGVD